MRNPFKISLVLALALWLVATGCSSSKGSHCGCPNKSGMVGYK